MDITERVCLGMSVLIGENNIKILYKGFRKFKAFLFKPYTTGHILVVTV